MKKLATILAMLPAALLFALPVYVSAQGQGMGPGMGPGMGGPPQNPEERFAQMEKRMRVARAIGLAEALDLDDKQAEKMREVLGRFDDQRRPLMKQVHDSMQVLRKAANGDKANLALVDDSVQKAFDARSRMTALDKEMFQAISKDLSPEKRARAAVFLAHFQGRFGAGMGPGRGHGDRGGPGHGPGEHEGRGHGPGGGHRMGPGPGGGGGMGPGPGGGGGMDYAPGGGDDVED
jgi:Spy/CpxP family protein refolding chaperone